MRLLKSTTVGSLFDLYAHRYVSKNEHGRNIGKPQLHTNMLYMIAVVLILAWLLGLVSSYTMGGLIHILLVVAIVMVLVRLIEGRRI